MGFLTRSNHKIGLPDGYGGETIPVMVKFGYGRVDLKVIWEMSFKITVLCES